MTKHSCPTPWLGESHGYLTDWITQRWVEMTGRLIGPERDHWLFGPIGKPEIIGKNYFDQLAAESGLGIRRNHPQSGLLEDFSKLQSSIFDVTKVRSEIVDFYEHTSNYDLDAWSEWSPLFRPFGNLLAFIFSRRLQQLNVPLSSLDTSHGLTSDIIQLVDKDTATIVHTAWLRKIVKTENILYAGIYSLCEVPGYNGPCIKVVFPLPNGNAIVIMKPKVHQDGSFSITSSGTQFGDPGFYFSVKTKNGNIAARYVRSMRETIHVYTTKQSEIRARHTLTLWGLNFLKLHYRLRRNNND